MNAFAAVNNGNPMEHTRVLIIGGGVYGVSLAYHLAREGWSDVMLVEKGELTSGSTWHAAGNTTNFAGSLGLSYVHDHGLKLYDEIQAETGQATGYHRCGGMRLAQTQEELNWFARGVGIAQHNGIACRIISTEEAKERHPFIEIFGIKGAVWMENDAYVDPTGVTMAMAKGARARGVKIVTNNRVTGLAQRASGEWEVETENGTVIAEQIVNAGGSFARRLGEMMGIKLPIVDMIHHYLVTETIPEIEALDFELPLVRDPYSSNYFRQERKGLVVGPYETTGAKPCYLEGPDWDTDRFLFPNELERLAPWLERAMERMPVAGTVGVRTTIAGAITYTPDGGFLLGPAPGLRNAWLACGSSVGICQGAGSGKYLAQWMVHGQAEISMNDFDPRRWGDYAYGEYTKAKAIDAYHRNFQLHQRGEDREAGRPLFKTPAYERQAEQGAVFGESFGWERPKWYAPNGETEEYSFARTNIHEIIGDECHAVRERAGVLDLSSFSKFEISGPNAEGYLNRLITGTTPKREGKSRLAYSTTADGFIENEWTITRFGENLFYLLGPAVSQTRDFDKLRFWRRSGEDVDVRNVSQEFGCLVLTGPRSRDILSELTDASLDNEAFPWLDAREISVASVPVRALRLSFVGELGWELHMPMSDLDTAYAAILEAGSRHGLANFGLYAVNSLRMEKGYGAWGHEYTMDVRMKEAGLSRFVHFHKDEFLGREALLACRDETPSRQIAYLEVDASDADCLGSEAVFADGKVVGLTTSGAYGHTSGKSLAFAYVDSDRMGAGDLEVGLLGQDRKVRVLSTSVHDPENALLKG